MSRNGLRRTPFRPGRGWKTERRTLKAQLDLLARRATFERAKHRCERCMKPDRLQWHHVYSRAIVTLRWDLDNLVALCAGCHLWWHHNPLDAAAWFEDHCERTDPKRKLRLSVSRQTVRKTDYAALRFMLERYVEVR